MSTAETCCTCATRLSDVEVHYYDADTDEGGDAEKRGHKATSPRPVLPRYRHLTCCHRAICARCQINNPRFQWYCPFCQIASADAPASALPRNGLRLPPSYPGAEESARPATGDDPSPPPPSYDDALTSRTPPSIFHDRSLSSRLAPAATEDTVHFVSTDDTFASLSLAYHVPITILKSHNNLYADGLLAARKWILIPRAHYTGPPLSQPPDPDEEERKTKVRRWMVATKCADYSVATLYLKGTDGDLARAVQTFQDDEEWEKAHPMKGKEREGQRRTMRYRGASGGGSLVSQLQ